MSERSKGDVSSSTVSRVNNKSIKSVKNPLLSASITGDDYPNKPQLLPAAPPVVHVPPPQPVLMANILNREPKTLVTVGQPSFIDDTENLDEINLNASNDDANTPLSSNLYQSGIADANANPLLEPTDLNSNTNDSLLSQAASSFTALPAVASNVFSTFSKRIYSGSNSRERTPQSEPDDAYKDIQPNFIQQADYLQQAPAPLPFYAAPPASIAGAAGAEATPLEPPKFYAPAEVPALPNVNAAPPPTAAGGQNTYRFTARKKLYAPIPGFSDQQAQQTQPQQPQQPQVLPFQTPPYPPQPAQQAFQEPSVPPFISEPATYKPPEERKTGGGLFSLTNLVPTGVLQNISGLVQSATGSLGGQSSPKNNEPSYSAVDPSADAYFDITTSGGGPQPQQSSANSFAAPPTAQPLTVPPVGSYFVPPEPAVAVAPAQPIGGYFVPGPAPAAPTAFFSPPNALSQAPAPPKASTESNLPVGPPPAVAAAVQPPPAVAAGLPPPPAAGQTSYRLQKGTRLYKSPLTTQESATSAYGSQGAFPPPPFASAAIFNPFSQTTTSVDPSAAFSSTQIGPTAEPTSQQVTEATSGVALYAAPPSTQPVPVATPTSQQLTEGHHGVALFTPASDGTSVLPQLLGQQSIVPPPAAALFAPPAAPSAVDPTSSLFGPANPAEAQSVSNLFAVIPRVQAEDPTNYQATVAAPPGVALFAPPPSVAEPTTNSTQGLALFVPPSVAASIDSAQDTALFTSAFEQTEQKLQPIQSFAAPAISVADSSVPPGVAQPTATATQGTPLYGPPPVAASSDSAQDTALFTSAFEQTDQKTQPIQPFAAPPISAAESSVPFFAPTVAAAITPAVNQEVPATAQPPTLPTKSAEAAVEAQAAKPAEQTVSAAFDNFLVSTVNVSGTTTTDAVTSTSLFQPYSAPQPGAFLTTQTTPTFFNPFAQTISTPLPQPTLAGQQAWGPTPSIGFVTPVPAPIEQQSSSALFEAQTIEPVVSDPEPAAAPAAFIAPPPSGPPKQGEHSASAQVNPFRRGQESATAAIAPQPASLLNFFTPAESEDNASTANDFNFFASAPTAPAGEQAGSLFPELPPQVGIAPPALAQEPPTESTGAVVAQGFESATLAPPPLGFEQLLTTQTEQSQNLTEDSYQNSSVNSFSGYFGGGSLATQQPLEQALDSANFFDHIEPQAKIQVADIQLSEQDSQSSNNEDQRIQNFFNNPPLQEQPAAPGELKYDIVHSGLAVKNLQARSQTQTPISNLVEPPSSACSEFSELSGTPQRQPPAAATAATTPPQRQAEQQATAQLQPGLSAEADDLLRQHYADLPEEILKELRMANVLTSEKGQATTPPIHIVYTPVVRHWFYKRSVGNKFMWTPFSHYDSALLETSLTSDDANHIVAVEGGRYDVNIKERTKTPVYWEGKAIEVRRCSWFYKGVDSKYVPYEEATAQLLEAEYKRAAETGVWHQKIMLSGGEQVVFHGPTVIVHFLPQQQSSDSWGASTQSSMRPRVVKRDLDDFIIEQGESQRVDHLLFMVHGIGSACDLKMRTVEEVVDDFRNIAQQLVQSHYKNSTDMGLVGRVEVLPISWHSHLHSEELGIDEKLKSITLESIPRLRNFTNDTLLDVLFYTSPTFCQKIMNTVATSLNEVYSKYRSRHPDFNGGVSLAGHSLGSLILFDLLCHQEPLKESEEENMENPDQLPLKDNAYKQVQLPPSAVNEMLPKQVSYAMGPAGTGQPVINYSQLIFHPKKFFALGSPIGMFVTIRGIDKLGLDFRLPTCPGFYNIFHPFDPVAYRIEALVNPDMNGIRPVLIPHHKGRKRMHLELKETMSRVGADIKQRFLDTFKTTLDSVNFLATVTKVKKEAEESLEKEVNTIYQKQIEDQEERSAASTSSRARNRTDSNSTTGSDPEFIELDFPLGKLNDSKRVDYVLQEAPLEFINEYIFALSSHVCYWESEDTILFVMKEIYAGLGISTDSQVPQQTMTIERPSSRTNSVSQAFMPL